MTNQFGMFIHWGIYAQTGIQEQVFAREDWDRARYERLAQTFCPSDYDPEAWVLLAKPRPCAPPASPDRGCRRAAAWGTFPA